MSRTIFHEKIFETPPHKSLYRYKKRKKKMKKRNTGRYKDRYRYIPVFGATGTKTGTEI